jgi:hypothetical protein
LELHDLIQSYRRTTDTVSPVSLVLERTLASARKHRAGSQESASAQSSRKPHDTLTPGNVLDFSAQGGSPSSVHSPPHTDPWQTQRPPSLRLDFDAGGLPLPGQRHSPLDGPGLLDVLQARQRPSLAALAETQRAEQTGRSGQRPDAPPPGNSSSQAASGPQPQRVPPPFSELRPPVPAAAAHMPILRAASEDLPTLSDAGSESLLVSSRLEEGGDLTTSDGSIHLKVSGAQLPTLTA